MFLAISILLWAVHDWAETNEGTSGTVVRTEKNFIVVED
jgi:hypothetical protein